MHPELPASGLANEPAGVPEILAFFAQALPQVGHLFTIWPMLLAIDEVVAAVFKPLSAVLEMSAFFVLALPPVLAQSSIPSLLHPASTTAMSVLLSGVFETGAPLTRAGCHGGHLGRQTAMFHGVWACSKGAALCMPKVRGTPALRNCGAAPFALGLAHSSLKTCHHPITPSPHHPP